MFIAASSLARYLNKNCKNTFAFFVNHNRMKNPLYSDMFRDIIQRKESSALRKYIADCMTEMKNMQDRQRGSHNIHGGGYD